MSTLSGTGGDNSLAGGNNADSLTGFGGDDTLAGNGGNDTISGGDGNDLLDGGSGNDRLVGGRGNDIYVVDAIEDVVVELASAGTDTIRTSLTSYSLAGLENIERLAFTGSVGASGIGNAGDNILTGGTGGDTLDGGAGTDTLRGGDGDDLLVQIGDSTGVERFEGGSGADTLRISNSVVTETENGPKYFVNLSGSVLLSVEKLAFRSAAQTEFLLTVNLEQLSDVTTLAGGAGFDRLIVNAGKSGTYQLPSLALTSWSADDLVYLVGERAVDYTLKASASHAGTQILTGNRGNDVLEGGAGNEIMVGGGGNDTLIGGAGGDRMIGGGGDDLYVLNTAGGQVVEEAGGGTDMVQTTRSSFSLAKLTNVEALAYTGSGAASLIGNVLDNMLTGGNGADTLDGGAGNDRLSGEGGDDVYIIDGSGDVIVEQAAAGTDTIRTALNSFSLADIANVENVVFTGTGGVNLIGNAASNVLTGGAGADTLDGSGGIDRLVGGGGDDVYLVDASGDVVVEAASAGIDTVRTILPSYSVADLSNVENIVFTGTGAANLTGNAANNQLVGAAGPNTLVGGGGDDTLAGGASDDTLDGGEGADQLSGGAGNDLYIVNGPGDLVVEDISGGSDTIQTAMTSFSLATVPNVENLRYSGSGDASLTGNAGANILMGGAGDDRLIGGGGRDTLTGNAGADRFVFARGDAAYATPGYVSDIITDYQDGSDSFSLVGGIGRGTGHVLHAGQGLILGSMAAAFGYAQALLNAHDAARDVAVLSVGTDSYLFYNDAGGATINSIIKLAGVADASMIDGSDFGS